MPRHTANKLTFQWFLYKSLHESDEHPDALELRHQLYVHFIKILSQRPTYINLGAGDKIMNVPSLAIALNALVTTDMVSIFRDNPSEETATAIFYTIINEDLTKLP